MSLADDILELGDKVAGPAEAQSPRVKRGNSRRKPSAPRRLEKSIERASVKRINKMGVAAPKFVSPGHRSRPDRLILPGNGRCMFLEFKRPGEVPTPLQLKEHADLRARGYVVGVPTSEDEAVAMVREFLES